MFFLEIIDPSNDPQIQIGGSLDEFGVTFYNRTEITVIDTDGTYNIATADLS